MLFVNELSLSLYLAQKLSARNVVAYLFVSPAWLVGRYNLNRLAIAVVRYAAIPTQYENIQ